jgi:hypothetical protein
LSLYSTHTQKYEPIGSGASLFFFYRVPCASIIVFIVPRFQSWARATFFEYAIAIPQLEESTSAIAIPQLFKAMLIRNRDSAIPQSQFFLKSAT